jgi:putative (di)nucleoside polyphosphate hydrolase
MVRGDARGARRIVTVDALPYRLCVGAALFNRQGRVFVARRLGPPERGGGGWQLPQGGIDAGEDPEKAVLRELAEEIGTTSAEVISRHPDWLSYDFPPDPLRHALHGGFRGQRQMWFALRFTGADADIRLDADPHPEFDAWRWAELDELPGLAVGFKRPVYEAIVAAFADFARPEAAPRVAR